MAYQVHLWSLSDFFILQTSTKEILCIDRKTATFSTTPEISLDKLPSTAAIKCFGIVGTIRLLRGNYLIIITEREQVGSIAGNVVYRLTKVDILPYDTRVHMLSPQQEEDEKRYLELLESCFASKAFYFSYTMDMTCNLQSQRKDSALWKTAEDHFFWNNYLCKDLLEAKLDKWILPMIRGFVSINKVEVGDKSFDFILVTRQSCKRVGTRYNVRGVDAQGNVANYCETEQIVVYKDTLFSFLQTRGSIPVFWNQKVNLKYKPRITFPARDNDSAFKNHFDEMCAKYKRVICIDLIDHKGDEKKLGDLFKSQIKKYNNPNVRYVDFDFHHECKGMKYENIGKLIDQVKNDLDTFGYFSTNIDTPSKRVEQTGVTRVNCIDNLDRTNVVQSVIAKLVLEKQLKTLNIFSENDKIENHPNLLSTFKNVWADNADAISFLYSGTGALKNDYTRTGKRSFYGLLSDGTNSAIRYYLNNFQDGKRQDATNLLLGKYVVNPKEESPFKNQNSLQYIYTVLKLALFTGLLMIFANILKIPTDDAPGYRAVLVLCWVAFTYLVVAILLWRGREVVNNPVLVSKKKKV